MRTQPESDDEQLLQTLRKLATSHSRPRRWLRPFVERWGADETARRVLRCVKRHPDPKALEVMPVAIEDLYAMPERVERALEKLVLAACVSTDKPIRLAALGLLDQFAGEEVVETLMLALLDSDEEIRVAAQIEFPSLLLSQKDLARLLSALSDPRYHAVGGGWNVLMALDAIFDDWPEEDQFRIACAIADALPALHNDMEDSTIWKATESLGHHIGGRLGAELLLDALVRYPGRIRDNCAWALQRIEPGILEEYLGPLRRSDDGQLRAIARELHAKAKRRREVERRKTAEKIARLRFATP